MGNSASAANSSSPGGEESPEVTSSGVFLADNLQQKILQDFQSKVLKEEWEKHQKFLLARGNKRRLEEFETKNALDQRLETFRQQDSIRQSQLDERIDGLRAKFSDLSTAMEFDANRMDQKLSSMNFKKENEAPCLESRTNIAMCLSDKSRSNCDAFMQALEKCVGDTVVNKQQ